jgi:hypothetical protein
MTSPDAAADDAGESVDQILRAVLVAAALRAAQPMSAAEGLAEVAQDMAQAFSRPPAGALWERMRMYDASCRLRLAQSMALDPVATAHLCAMGWIPADDPRHRALLDRLFTTPGVPQRMARVCAGEA